MNPDVNLSCALIGDAVGKSEHVPVTPEQIAESGIQAVGADATVVHVHVRDPQTGRGARDPELNAEVVERIEASGEEVIGLIEAMGSRVLIPSEGRDKLGLTGRG